MVKQRRKDWPRLEKSGYAWKGVCKNKACPARKTREVRLPGQVGGVGTLGGRGKEAGTSQGLLLHSVFLLRDLTFIYLFYPYPKIFFYFS